MNAEDQLYVSTMQSKMITNEFQQLNKTRVSAIESKHKGIQPSGLDYTSYSTNIQPIGTSFGNHSFIGILNGNGNGNGHYNNSMQHFGIVGNNNADGTGPLTSGFGSINDRNDKSSNSHSFENVPSFVGSGDNNDEYTNRCMFGNSRSSDNNNSASTSSNRGFSVLNKNINIKDNVKSEMLTMESEHNINNINQNTLSIADTGNNHDGNINYIDNQYLNHNIPHIPWVELADRSTGTYDRVHDLITQFPQKWFQVLALGDWNIMGKHIQECLSAMKDIWLEQGTRLEPDNPDFDFDAHPLAVDTSDPEAILKRLMIMACESSSQLREAILNGTTPINDSLSPALINDIRIMNGNLANNTNVTSNTSIGRNETVRTNNNSTEIDQ